MARYEARELSGCMYCLTEVREEVRNWVLDHSLSVGGMYAPIYGSLRVVQHSLSVICLHDVLQPITHSHSAPARSATNPRMRPRWCVIIARLQALRV